VKLFDVLNIINFNGFCIKN